MKKATIWRKHTNKMLRQHCAALPVRTVLDVGAGPEHEDKEGRAYREYFPSAERHTLDFRITADDPNHYTCDLHDTSGIANRFDLILCMNVLEHVRNPFVVADNLKTLLNPQGYIFVAVPFVYKLHGLSYGDYWRFTHMGLKTLFDDMDTVMLGPSPDAERWGYVGLFRALECKGESESET